MTHHPAHALFDEALRFADRTAAPTVVREQVNLRVSVASSAQERRAIWAEVLDSSSPVSSMLERFGLGSPH